MENAVVTQTRKIEQKSRWQALCLFMLANLAIAFIFYFLSSGFIYPFASGGEPSFSMPPKVILWMIFSYLVILGVINFMLFSLSKNLNNFGMRLTLLLFYIFMGMTLLWALFSFTLKMPIVGVVILGLTIAFGIYLTYRYLTRSVVAGSILTLFILNLIYIFVTQLGYCLVV